MAQWSVGSAVAEPAILVDQNGSPYSSSNPLQTAGGGGGAVTVADGADVAQGARSDAAWDGSAGSATLVAIGKAVWSKIGTTLVADVTDRAGRLLGHVTVDNATLAVTQSGTWTVQPGNTANTTAWKVDGSGVTQPVSGTVTANAGSGTFSTSDTGAAITGQTLEAGGSGLTGWLASIRKAVTDRLGTLGQKTMANSTPVVVASDQSAVPASQSGTWTVQPGNTPNTSAWLVSQTPATSGGLSISRTLSAASTNATNAKGSAGQVYGWVITNTNAAARFVKLYNKATSPTVGTDTPVMTLVIPGNANGAGQLAAEFTSGIAFSAGIGYAITTGVADSDTGAVAANEVVVNLLFK
jgi:hypothetical protein